MVVSQSFGSAPQETTYTVTSGVDEIEVELSGAEGGTGGNIDGAAGGAGATGIVRVTLESDNETVTVYVGESGGDGADESAGAGGGPTFEGAARGGGDGGGGTNDFGGGGGGGPTAVVAPSGTTYAAAGAGGGGGAESAFSKGGGGGGGGALNGAGGVGDGGGSSGESAAGTLASGGDGGNSADQPAAGADGAIGAGSGATILSSTTGGSTTATGEVTIREAPPAATLSVGDRTTDSITVDIADTSDEDGVELFVKDPGGSFSSLQTYSAGEVPASYTLSGLDGGEQKIFKTEATNSAGTSTDTLTASTVLPAPTDLTATVAGDDITLSWTDNASQEDGYRIYRSRDGGASYTQIADLAADTSSYSDTGLLDGEEYTYEVRAYAPDVESASAPVSATTVLPDVGVPDITRLVEDELTARYDDVTDYGQYRLQLRETNEGQAYGAVADLTVGQDTTAITATGLEDGERYDLRLRSETEHVDGAWAETAATTLLPAPTLGSPTTSTDSVTVPWTDNADNEDAYLVERRKQYDGGEYGPYTTLATLAPDTTTYTDSTVQPATTYDYRVVAETEHTTATSAPATVTTDSLGYGRDRVGGSGWTVEVDTETGTRRPAVVGEPQFDPSLNQLPRVELPVAPDGSWFDASVEDAPLRVWRDGERLPIEQVADVQERPGETVLVGLGGTELLEPQQQEFDDTDAHAAATTVIDQTSYTRIVDDPSADTSELASIESDVGISDVIENNVATQPVVIDDGVRPAQTNFWREAENAASSGITDNVQFDPGDPEWSGAEAVNLRTAFGVSFTIETEHRIPASNLEITTRASYDNYSGQVGVEIDGTVISRYQFETNDIVIKRRDHSGGGLEAGITSDLPPGEHTVTVYVAKNTEGAIGGKPFLDALSLHDTRYHDSSSWAFGSWDESVYFNDPPLFPSSFDIRFLHEGFLSATGAQVEVAGVDATDGFGLALSNDDGQSFAGSATNSTTLDVTFGSPGPDVLLRTTHTAHGSRDIFTPLQNFETHTAEGWTIDIDTRNSPPIQNTAVDTEAQEILTRLAERGIAVWAVTWDESARQLAVEFTNAGQREADRTLDLVEYEWSKATLGRQVTSALVTGGAARTTGEEFEANHGTEVTLSGTRLVVGSEQITDTNGVVFTRGADYQIEYLNGQVETLASGSITDGETLVAEYSSQPFGSYAAPGGVEDKKQLRETFSAATSDSLCRSIAFYLVQELKAPIRTGTAVIDDLPAGVSVLDALAADPLPTSGTYAIEGVDVTDGRVELTFRNRRSVNDVVSDLRSRLDSVSDRV